MKIGPGERSYECAGPGEQKVGGSIGGIVWKRSTHARSSRDMSFCRYNNMESPRALLELGYSVAAACTCKNSTFKVRNESRERFFFFLFFWILAVVPRCANHALDTECTYMRSSIGSRYSSFCIGSSIYVQLASSLSSVIQLGKPFLLSHLFLH